MRWPWQRNRVEDGPAPSGDTAEAVRARQCAEQALQRTKDLSAEIRRVADASRSHRSINHFAELIGETFRGQK